MRHAALTVPLSHAGSAALQSVVVHIFGVVAKRKQCCTGPARSKGCLCVSCSHGRLMSRPWWWRQIQQTAMPSVSISPHQSSYTFVGCSLAQRQRCFCRADSIPDCGMRAGTLDRSRHQFHFSQQDRSIPTCTPNKSLQDLSGHCWCLHYVWDAQRSHARCSGHTCGAAAPHNLLYPLQVVLLLSWACSQRAASMRWACKCTDQSVRYLPPSPTCCSSTRPRTAAVTLAVAMIESGAGDASCVTLPVLYLLIPRQLLPFTQCCILGCCSWQVMSWPTRHLGNGAGSLQSPVLFSNQKGCTAARLHIPWSCSA